MSNIDVTRCSKSGAIISNDTAAFQQRKKLQEEVLDKKRLQTELLIMKRRIAKLELHVKQLMVLSTQGRRN